MIRIIATLKLLTLLIIDIVRSSLLLAWDVISPKDYSTVRILTFSTRAETDLELLLLSCAITLTPGSLTLDVGDDRRTLIIHAMYAADAEGVLRDIRERYETPLLTAMRGRRPA
jgi:multicomponent Na+:H+ antiporter subunit E